MNPERVTIWIQVATGIAVVAGLGLVVWELQQVKTLTRAQLTSDHFAAEFGLDASVMGENPSDTLAKACSDPTQLSHSEVRILSELYGTRLEFVERIKILTQRDGIYEEGYWETRLRTELAQVFDSAFGRVWFLQQHPDWYSEGLRPTLIGEGCALSAMSFPTFSSRALAPKRQGAESIMRISTRQMDVDQARGAPCVPHGHALWADGHGRQPSESRLYFCDREGRVFMLPVEMKGDFAEPIEVER